MSTPVWTPLGPGCVIHDAGMTVAGRITDIAIDRDNPLIMYAGTPCGGIWKTTDGGLNWIPKGDTQETLGIGCITLDDNRILAGTGEFNENDNQAFGIGVLVSTDGGDTWERRPADNTFDGARFCRILVDPGDGRHWFAATTKGLFETIDDGVSWNRIQVGRAEIKSVCDAVMDTAGPGHVIYVAKPREGVFRKSANDTDFVLLNDFNTRFSRVALALAPSQTNTLFAVFDDEGANGRLSIFKTDNATDDSTKWEARGLIKDQTQSDYNLTIAVAPQDPATVYVGAIFLWRSRNSGEKWEQLPKKPQPSPIHTDHHVLVFHPTNPSTLWLGNDGGIFLSLDGGDTFAHRNRGLQNLQLYAGAQHPLFESVFFGGTQDNAGVRFEGSAAWVDSGIGDAFDVMIDQANPRTWYYGLMWDKTFEAGPFFRSEDAGVTYQGKVRGLVGSDLPGITDFKMAMDPANSSILYIGTTKLYVSTDRGDSWVRIKKRH